MDSVVGGGDGDSSGSGVLGALVNKLITLLEGLLGLSSGGQTGDGPVSEVSGLLGRVAGGLPLKSILGSNSGNILGGGSGDAAPAGAQE